MRLALISDIHGNPVAFDAVLATLENEGVDQIVCLGDVAIFGPQPRAALAKLRKLNCPVVMGNTDAWALDPSPHPLRNADSHKFNAIELWCAHQLTESDQAFMHSFQPTVEIALNKQATVFCFHGSPTSFHDAILATTADGDLERMFGGIQATVMAGGHTHTQLLRRYAEMLILNPGSVGLPFERPTGTDTARNPAWAEFAIVESVGDDLCIELRRTPFDLNALVEMTLSSGMPYAEWWVHGWG